jgi:hypothetical protein
VRVAVLALCDGSFSYTHNDVDVDDAGAGEVTRPIKRRTVASKRGSEAMVGILRL